MPLLFMLLRQCWGTGATPPRLADNVCWQLLRVCCASAEDRRYTALWLYGGWWTLLFMLLR
jgi:hypothetical protein